MMHQKSMKIESLHHIEVVQAKYDADTQIVKTALKLKQENSDCSVQILANDTNILCLLLHHCYVESYNEIMIRSLTSTSLSKRKNIFSSSIVEWQPGYL